MTLIAEVFCRRHSAKCGAFLCARWFIRGGRDDRCLGQRFWREYFVDEFLYLAHQEMQKEKLPTNEYRCLVDILTGGLATEKNETLRFRRRSRGSYARAQLRRSYSSRDLV